MWLLSKNVKEADYNTMTVSEIDGFTKALVDEKVPEEEPLFSEEI
jgi:hypothetical protein